MIAITSDLHGVLPQIEECDLLLICGDIMPLNIQSDSEESFMWLHTTFKNWCQNCGAKKVVFIAGNHDLSLYWRRKELKSDFLGDNIIYLKDESVTIDGITIYGTPWCHRFGRWAFMREDDKLAEKYNNIPKDVDILLTHDAPRIANFGKILDPKVSTEPVECGNAVLAAYIIDKSPKYAFCGHIHSGDHNLATIGNTTFANVSYVDESYSPTNKVLYLDYEH